MLDQLPTGVEALELIRQLESSEPVIHITRSERGAEALARFLSAALPDRSVEYFPPWDCLPFDSASPTPAAMGRRMAVLRRLQDADAGCIVIVPLQAMLQRLPPREAVHSHAIRTGEILDSEALQRFCEKAGYDHDERIDEPGEMAFHGGTIELFPAGDPLPCRLELADGRVSVIRRFDPVSQRSLSEVEEIVLVPVTELPPSDEARPRGGEHHLPKAYDRLSILSDHLPDARLTISAAALAAADDLLARIDEARKDASEGRADTPAADALYLNKGEWMTLAQQAQTLPFVEWQPVPAFATERRPRAFLARFLAAQAEEGRRLIFTAHSKAEQARLQRMVRQAGANEPQPAAAWAAAAEAGNAVLVADLDRGFVTGDLAVVTAADLFGSRAEQPDDLFKLSLPGQVQATGLELGDLVIHEDHGLGRLEGMEPLDGSAPGPEAIRLVYANDERLLVPSSEAGRIWRYGSGDAGIRLDRLRGAAWLKRRQTTREALDRLAADLVALTDARGRTEAPKLVPPARDYERFVSRFPYPATPDQVQAVRAALADMASGYPMDRLVIGDVGFGKTEVALRAAAAAALSGRQVVVAAPTTVLAR
ncbi:CarD family transcriptional regulator, partial [Paracoccus sp. (in: a-proteobacteria)]|uniref:CarD family transcriptional regulator n=1 Tax=Paracoccus sp. TaxID=267 RepID=UPI00396CA18F